eukprot:6196395-Pleurochrysis_carterae.AAC.1
MAADKIGEAAANGAKIVMLPECWNSPYDSKQFPQWAEEVPAVGGQVRSAMNAASLSDISSNE